jgi:xylulokinase
MMFLGIDCGTQGTKALLVDESLKVVGRGYASHALIERPSGAREQNPAWWVAAMIEAVGKAWASAAPGAGLQALAVSGQQHGLVVLDEAMQVIRPAKLWNDTETEPQNRKLIERFGGQEEFYRRFGIVPLTGYTVSKLLWLAECEPENFKRIRHILLPHEYLNFWLTGELKAEYGDASGTAYFNVRTREWNREVLDSIDGGTGQLFAALPQLIGPTEAVGRLQAGAARELGVAAGCVVAAGGGDNMMGAIGTGNVRRGIVTMSLGTSGTVYSFSTEVPQDASGSVAPFCSSAGGWLPLVCTMNATNVVTATVHLLGKTVADIEDALTSTSPGADGLIFLPFVNGERTPDLPQASGSLHGITAHNLTPAHLIRAAVEGVSFGLLDGLDGVLAGSPAEVIQLIGGGARSMAWRQLLADATGATIQVPMEEEAGCLGAVAQAVVAYGCANGQNATFEEVTRRLVRVDAAATCTPDPGRRSSYDAARAAFMKKRVRIHGI